MQQPEDTHGSGVVKRDPAALRSLQEGEGGGGNGTKPSFTDFDGLVLTGVQVHLIFWGAAWITTPPPSPSSDTIQPAVKTILAGPYLANLYQYRRICYGTFDGSTVSSSTDPSNPFTNDDVVQFLTTLFNDNTLPDPRTHPQMFYCVIMPAKVHSDQWSATDPDKKLVGEHSYFVYGSPNPVNVHFAWVSDPEGNGFHEVTRVFSHELVETCSDPEGTGIRDVATGTCATNRNNWCEIGDFSCDGTTATLDGVTVQPYWSVKDNACTVPTQRDQCCSERATVDDLLEQIQILQSDLQDIWEIPANIRERVRALYLKELHSLERELDAAKGHLQQCEARG